jgi:hypothetical protein
MAPQVAFCGMFDQVQRATRAYELEMARHRLQP